MMPLFHIHGLTGALSTLLVAGASTVCAPGFRLEQVMGWISESAPTWYTAVPTLHQAILEQVCRQLRNTQPVHLRFIRSYSSALAPQLARDLETAFDAPVLEA
jgi:acyl-CoA synthetase (AMP-forming)/AMP-acid ligase II